MQKNGFLVFPLLLVFGNFLWAQEEVQEEVQKKAVNLSGPRVGMTFFTEAIDTLDGNHYTTQFGYYFEHQFRRTEKITLATDVVLLMGGMEKGLFFPSLTWIVGFRTANRMEIGVGPNYVPYEGLGYTIAAGMTLPYGNLYLPLNIALVLAKESQRVTLLIGFAGELKF